MVFEGTVYTIKSNVTNDFSMLSKKVTHYMTFFSFKKNLAGCLGSAEILVSKLRSAVDH